MKATVKEKLSYLKQSVFHPFDAFYEIRFRGKGSVPLAVLILAVCVGALLLSQREDAHDLSDLIGEEGVTVDGTFSLEGW